MKATELRIGSTYMSTKFGVPVTLELADLCELYHRCDGAEIDEGIIDSLVKPIPLTEEWMVKLGFRKSNNVDHIYLFPENDSLRMWGFAWNVQQFEFSENWIDIITPPIRFVHQLQNLYSVLTGKELVLQNV